MSGPSRLRRLAARVAVSLPLLASLLFTPLAPLFASAEPKMACCTRGKKHSCCARKAKSSGPALQAAPRCGKSCAQLPPLPSGAAAALGTVASQEPVAPETRLLIAGTGRPRAIRRPDPLFQRPPPFLSPVQP